MLIILITSGSAIASVLAYSVRNARKPAGKPDMNRVWAEGGPL